jgi:hypothetical protein
MITTMETGRSTNHHQGSMTANDTSSVPSLTSNCSWGGWNDDDGW